MMDMIELRYATKHLINLLPHKAVCIALGDVYSRVDQLTRENIFTAQTGRKPTNADFERVDKSFPTASIRSTICALVDSLSPAELTAFYLNTAKIVRLEL